MGYIDDKARDADNTIKGVGIILIIVIALCCMAGSIEGGLIAFIVILGLGILGLILWAVYKHSQEKEQEKEAELARQREADKAAKQRQEEFEATQKRYSIRIAELGFVKRDQLTIWRKYSNSDDCYKEYFWKDSEKLWEIDAEPTEANYTDGDYQHPEKIKKTYTEIAKINYITIEGNYCVLYYEWKPFYFRKDAIDIFRKFVPEKIK